MHYPFHTDVCDHMYYSQVVTPIEDLYPTTVLLC